MSVERRAMITTVTHKGLTIRQIYEAQKNVSTTVEKIERALKLPKGFELTLAISASFAQKLHTGKSFPVFRVYIVAPCEIVSFDDKASIATRIVAGYDFAITRFTEEAIKDVTKYLKRQVRTSRP